MGGNVDSDVNLGGSLVVEEESTYSRSAIKHNTSDGHALCVNDAALIHNLMGDFRLRDSSAGETPAT